MQKYRALCQQPKAETALRAGQVPVHHLVFVWVVESEVPHSCTGRVSSQIFQKHEASVLLSEKHPTKTHLITTNHVILPKCVTTKGLPWVTI